MLLIALDSDPVSATLYRQGLEIAMLAADCGSDVTAVIEGSFLERLREARGNEDFVKQLRQLELFEIPAFCLEEIPFLSFVKKVPPGELRALFENNKFLVF